MTFPFCNQADLLTAGPRVIYEQRRYDVDGTERTERRNGAYQCPECGLWWPVIEEPDCWTQSDDDPSRWDATGWWGGVVCEECQLLMVELMVEQPDGAGEVYKL